jgi:glutathione S-transferase
MSNVTLHGASYSVYVRIARLVLEETDVPYDLVEVDIFSKDSLPADYAGRHPFGKIPAFEHEGFRLFETDAIAHYVIEAFDKEKLMPELPRDRARCIQIMRIMDNYAYPSWVWRVFMEEVGRERPEQLEAEDIARARKVLAVLDELMGQPFLVGAKVTLADLWAAPMFVLFRMAPSGRKLIAEFPKVMSWWELMRERPALKATRFPRELDRAENENA